MDLTLRSSRPLLAATLAATLGLAPAAALAQDDITTGGTLVVASGLYILHRHRVRRDAAAD